jgi:radical SAM superfamily enzyme YgiQ (UPF0313 family)
LHAAAKKIFRLVLVKPSHYDDDGYVIQWIRSAIPSNTMAAIYGIALDCIERSVLGADVEIRVSAYDETNTHVDARKIGRSIRESGGHGLVALVGVQTNQFPRAVALGAEFLAEGVPVCIGGFHVSGCVSMLPETPADLTDAMNRGLSLFAGELEGRLDALLADAYAGTLRPLYDFSADLPHLDDRPAPYLPARVVGRMTETRASFDAGRGCPFTCSFCTIINVQGNGSRHRTADDVERIIRTNVAQGITKFFITDDNFARNKAWEEHFDRIIRLRDELGVDLKLTVQVDTLCHKIPRFIEKAGRAGVEKVFIGLESINPDALEGSGKTQNKITEYRAMLQAWHAVNAVTLAGYILGFPNDTPESILRDMRVIQRELPIDVLEFFILTPLPGSQDHKDLYLRGAPLDPDMNNYDSTHVTTPHAVMSDDEWLDIYRRAWDAYYTPEHVETVMRRARNWGTRTDKVKWIMLSYASISRIENVHPLDGGLVRRKYRRDRRPGLPLESRLAFYSRFVWDTLRKNVRLAAMYFRYQRTYRRVLAEPAPDLSADLAMHPAHASDLDALELFSATTMARSVADRARRTAALRNDKANAA